MRVWAVTMVKDELDILPYTLTHLVNEGIDGIIVADNLSTDGTWEMLQELQLACDLKIERDNEVGYYQSSKMTALARRAFDNGADWVIPFDADELWHNAHAPRSLHDTLADIRQPEGCLQCILYNYFPTSTDTDDPNPFCRITHRDRDQNVLPKVIVSNGAGITIEQGNHGAHATNHYPRSTCSIRVAHFPWRSAEQFVRKARNGAAAYQATDLPADQGAHWRGYGKVLEERGPEAVADIFREWFLDPARPLKRDPAPWRRSYNT